MQICSKTGRKLTFNQIITLTKQIAESLKSYGIKKHEVVGICMQSGIEYLPLVMAITSIEAVCATSNPSYTVGKETSVFRSRLRKKVTEKKQSLK